MTGASHCHHTLRRFPQPKSTQINATILNKAIDHRVPCPRDKRIKPIRERRDWTNLRRTYWT